METQRLICGIAVLAATIGLLTGATKALAVDSSTPVDIANQASASPTVSLAPSRLQPLIDTSYPLSDADAAAKVQELENALSSVASPDANSPLSLGMGTAATTVNYLTTELVPGNYTDNHTKPTAAQLKAVKPLGFLTVGGNYFLSEATGQYTGTTGQILTWAANKWGFNASIVMAIAQGESHWKETARGADYNGYSWGIMQVKQTSFAGTYPISHTSTAFNVDFKLAYQRACMANYIPYLQQRTPTGGHAKYYSATGSEKIWGCVGNWFSGGWYDAAAINYIKKIQQLYNDKDWLTNTLYR